VNAASLGEVSSEDRNLAPGVIFSIFGTSLTDGTTAEATRSPLPTRLAGARVLVNGTPAPLFFASPLQINAQFPVEEVTGPASVEVEVNTPSGTVTSEPTTVAVGSASPGIFTWDLNGKGPGAILRNSDFGAICPQGRTDCPPNFAGLGEVIAIYMTGLGAVDGPWASGQVDEVALPTRETPVVTIGGKEAPVLFSGLAAGEAPVLLSGLSAGSVGLYQVNVALPRGISLTDSVSLQVGLGKERFVFCPSGSTECSVLSPEAVGVGEDWQIFCPPGIPSGTSSCSALPPGEVDTSQAILLPQGVTFRPPTSNTVTIATSKFPRSIQAGGDPVGGIITSIAIDPRNSSTVYAGTDGGGIFQSTDGGRSWTAANSGLTDSGVNVVAVAPSSPETLYAGTDGSGVFKSTDGGQAWSPVNTGITYRSIRALAIHPVDSGTVYAGTSRLFKSTNGGESWQEVSGCDRFGRCSGIRSLAIDPTGTLFVGTASRGVFISGDGGQTWSDINEGFCPTVVSGCFEVGRDTGPIHDLAMAGGVYAATDVGVLRFVGLGWILTSCLGPILDQRGLCGVQYQSLAIDPSDPAIVYAGTQSGVHKTTDGGNSWASVSSGIQEVTPQALIQALAVDPNNPSIVYAGSGTDTGVFQTTNGGDSWSVINSGLTAADAPSLAIDPVNSDTVYAGVIGRGIFKSSTGGQNWTNVNSEVLLAGGIAIDPTNSAILYACCNPFFGPFFGMDFGSGNFYRTTDGGQNWVGFSGGGTRLVIDPTNPATLYGGSLGFVGSSSVGGALSKSTDGGQNWTSLTESLPGYLFGLGLAIYDLAIDPLNTSTLYAATSTGVVKTTDGGSTWTTINSGLPKGVIQTPAFSRQGQPLFPLAPTEPVQALAIDPVNPDTLYGGTTRGVFKTTNGGLSWTGSGLITQSVYTLAIDPANSSTIYVGTQDGGVFKSTDGGQSWSSSGSPSAPVQALAIDPINPSTIYAATSGGGVFKSTDGGESWQPVGKVTVLAANFINGNTNLFRSRVYLWNPSNSPGAITVRVFTMPSPGPSAPPEPSQLLGTLPLGTLEARSARTIRIEEVLTDLGIPLPYTENDGDLTLEFTIEVAGVRGAAQVFDNSLTLAFGTYPLQEISSASNTSPTVLVANFINGNTDDFNSRVYLWNPSTSAGEITVRVFTMPRPGPSAPPEPSQLLGTLPLGTLEARSARTIRIEEVLTDLGIPLPYQEQGGNLMLEFTIGAAGVRGAAQVFNNSLTLAFGVYPLQEISSASNTNPTVLVANFINGNTDFFRSRVYLWNPSTGAGEITVRVFTMPRPGPSAPPEPSQLLGTLPLGSLEARSARTIRLEEVLSDLGITLPYQEQGGNLMLEFTIEVAGVRGAAQVFKSSLTLAFGTYPIQEISSASNTNPTVLVANFTNGNTDFFRSRVYLWNPSTSAGEITVRVFTMPRPGPSAPPEPSQLLGTLPLGTLEARSARTIRLEEVLSGLGIPLPYQEQAGNLMLEFTIGAAGARGAAQVFNHSLTLAFGTYQLQVIE